MVGLDPPATIPSNEDLHQLRPPDGIGRDGDARWHCRPAVHRVVDVDDRHVRCDKAEASDDVCLDGALVNVDRMSLCRLLNAGAPYMTIPKRLVNETSPATSFAYRPPSPAFQAEAWSATMARIAASEAASCARAGPVMNKAQTMSPIAARRVIPVLLSRIGDHPQSCLPPNP